MAMTVQPDNDAARKALEAEGEILAALDRITEDTSPESAAPVPESTPAVVETLSQRLQSLEPLIDVAVDSGNEAEVRRLCQQGTDIIHSERVSREQYIEELQNEFDDALREHGEAGAVTLQIAENMQVQRASLQDFDTYIEERENYNREVIAGMHPVAEQAIHPAEAPTAPQERAATLDELLVALERAEAAYTTRLAELKAEKINVAEQLAAARQAQAIEEAKRKANIPI